LRNGTAHIRKEDQMGTEENKAIIRRFHELSKEDPDRAVREIVSADVIHHAGHDSGRESYLGALNKFQLLGVTYHIGDMIAEGDRVAVWWVKDDGPPADVVDVMSHIYRVVDGKIVESINTTLEYK
jgi:predicted SnoaL-like aldol condensation-catalyzing enzyme